MNTFLTPSSIAAELRPDLDPEDACELYTGAPPITAAASQYVGQRVLQKLADVRHTVGLSAALACSITRVY